MSGYLFLKRDCPTWNQVWDSLKAKFGDVVCENPQNGECWQYMGSTMEGQKVAHTFRHRSLPAKKGEREYFVTRTEYKSEDYIKSSQ